MSDSIQPIRYNSQLKQVKPKEDSGHRKDRKKEGKKLLDYTTKKDEKDKIEIQNKNALNQESTDNGKKATEDPQEVDDSDNDSGTILDVEV